ncbi:hypothetical protein ACFSNO_26270 [Streptomyces cirratus]
MGDPNSNETTPLPRTAARAARHEHLAGPDGCADHCLRARRCGSGPPRTRTFGPASTVLLDVLTAAGSVRPAGPLPWGSLLAAAAVIALCGIVGAGLHSVTGRVDHTTPNT